jgi:hypothetical protein
MMHRIAIYACQPLSQPPKDVLSTVWARGGAVIGPDPELVG